MERLTIQDKDNDVTLNCGGCSNDGSLNCDIENCYLTAICRLATIESILGDTYDLSRLKELVEADREGKTADVSQVVPGRCPVCEDYDKFTDIVCYDGNTGKHISLNFCPLCGAKMALEAPNA